MSSPQEPRDNAKRWSYLMAGAVVVAVAAWFVFGALQARFAAEPIGAVVQAIGRLEPFTRTLSPGSIVLFGGDTVGILNSVVVTETPGSDGTPLRLVRGRWLSSASGQLRGHESLTGRVTGTLDSAKAMIVTLDTIARPSTSEAGVLTLEPDGRIIRLVANR